MSTELYGLIGKKLSHSFSKEYFTKKFAKEELHHCQYELFELEDINTVLDLIKSRPLRGLNVTIPFKQDVIQYLDDIDPVAKKIGAVNVIKIIQGKLYGYNSDYDGFKASLTQWIPANSSIKAIVLGTGGAAKAVLAVLNDLGISYQSVSRKPKEQVLSYQELKKKPKIFQTHKLIINTTPLGMYPDIESYPDIDYSQITPSHFLYDLIYNPEITRFLSYGTQQGARAKNGIEMLHLQAEKAWEIWNTGT